jgi:very-short-patch-repair endonuclease
MVNYKKSIEPVIIICPNHGEFLQTPNSHLSNYGCNDCAVEKNSLKKRITIEEFIEKSINIHGNKYDYSKSEYNGCDKKLIIICKKHGEFLQTPYTHSRGAGCQLCVNKTEAKLYEKIITIYPYLQTQFKQDWCIKKSYLPFDFCIPEYKIIIELDGPQHFIQIMNWSSPEEQFENDKYKEECANQNGYSVIRLLQEDVFYDTYDWVKELCDAIEDVKSSEGITNVYLFKNDEYDQF